MSSEEVKDCNGQTWFCEKCNWIGTVKYQLHADVMTVIYLIEEDHKRISPDCDQPITGIRVVNASNTN